MNTKETRLSISLFIGFILFNICRFIIFRQFHIQVYLLTPVLYLIVVSLWTIRIRRHYLNQSIRRYLSISGYLLIGLLICRTLRYEFVPIYSSLSHYLWYAYYITFLCLPVFFFLCTQLLRDDHHSYQSILFIITGLLVVIVLSNDIHEWVFHFINKSHGIYEYSFGYYIVILFIILVLLGSIINAIRFIRGRVYLTFILLLCSLIYVVFYWGNADSFLYKAITLPEFMCLFSIGFWESLVIEGLIPTNSHHNTIFEESSIHACLMTDKQIVLSSPTFNQTMFHDENYAMRHRHIQGGEFYWFEDVSELNALKKELENIQNDLKLEKDMLETSVRMKEEFLETQTKQKLYADIEEDLHPLLEELLDFLNHLPEEEEILKTQLRDRLIDIVYIKRYVNLRLLALDKTIPVEELYISLKEYIEYLQLLGIRCDITISSHNDINAKEIVDIFQLFHTVIHEIKEKISVLFLSIHDNAFMMRFDTEYFNPLFCINEEEESIVLTYPLGSDNV